MKSVEHFYATVIWALGTTGSAFLQVFEVIPDVPLAKCATVVGIVAMIYLIQLHRKNIAKVEIETKLAQLRYDQQMLGRREEDLK